MGNSIEISEVPQVEILILYGTTAMTCLSGELIGPVEFPPTDDEISVVVTRGMSELDFYTQASSSKRDNCGAVIDTVFCTGVRQHFWDRSDFPTADEQRVHDRSILMADISTSYSAIEKSVSRPAIAGAIAAVCGGGVIWTDGKYIRSKESRKFSFAREQLSTGFRRVPLIGKWQREKRAAAPIESLIPNFTPPEERQLTMLRRLRMDYSAAQSLATTQSVAHQLRFLMMIGQYNGTMGMTRDRHGRWHSPFTSCPKEIRPYITIDGVRMVGVDTRSSHPSLLPCAIGNLVPRKELDKYREMVEHPEHCIYRHFIDTVPEAFVDIDPSERRNACKKTLMGVLCGGYLRPRCHRVRLVLSAFERAFPAMGAAMRQIKKSDPVERAEARTAGHKYKPYARLSHKLQKIESEVMKSAVDKMHRIAPGHPRAIACRRRELAQ